MSQVLLSGVYALRNVTVDDADPSITYIGDWLITRRTDRYMSTTHYTRTLGSYATFSFTSATRIYYMGYGILKTDKDTTISIVFDDETQVVDIHRVAEEQLQAILWVSDILDPTVRHTIECRKISESGGGRDLNVDAFILTIPDAVVPPTFPITASSFNLSSSSRNTVAHSPNSSELDATVAHGSTVSRATTNSPSTIIWNPSLALNTPYVPSSTHESQSNGAIQTLVVNSSRPIPLSKSAITGIILGIIGLLCLIAIMFFYLGRRRPLQEPEATYFPHPSPQWMKDAFDNGHHMDLPGFSGPAQPRKRQTQASHEASHQRGAITPISNDHTQSHPDHGRISLVAYLGVIDTLDIDAPATGLPPYTVRPISGHCRIGAPISRRERQEMRDITERLIIS
ncbi:hypothetical protein FS842_000850 [Serendipita sp. 407]|nr:hypothetical protein FS842_000850 [Serendipita sp. 407]